MANVCMVFVPCLLPGIAYSGPVKWCPDSPYIRLGVNVKCCYVHLSVLQPSLTCFCVAGLYPHPRQDWCGVEIRHIDL